MKNRQSELREGRAGSFFAALSTQHCLYKPSLCQIVLAGPAWFSV